MPRLGPPLTPKSLRILILATLGISIFSAMLQKIFPAFPLQEFLSLSKTGIEHFYLWQLVSYLFVHPGAQGLSFGLLLAIAFNAYVLWVIGSTIINRKGSTHFLLLYFLGGLLAAGAVLWLQFLFSISLPFAGNWAALYAILVAWVILYPETELLLLLTIPIKGKWLVIGLLGANLVIDLSIGSWISAAAYFTGAFAGYIYGVFVWHLKGPFVAFHPIEKRIISLLGGSQKKQDSPLPFPRAKIYDFKTGKALLSDQEFLDAMLTKISIRGVKSLSWREKWRLRRISKKDKKK